MSTPDKKQMIVTAAIECLEMYGRAGVTIRKIAERAGVNSAAISYYFGGTENLMEVVMQKTLANAFDVSHFSEFEAGNMKSYLKAVFSFLIEGAAKWPNISKAHFYSIYVDSDYNSPVTAAVDGFLKEVYSKVKDKTVAAEEVLKFRISILMAQVVYLIISPGLLQEFSPAKDVNVFVNDLIDNIFGEE